MVARSLLSWLKGSKTSLREARNRRAIRRFVPGMEALEAREVPAVFSIVNAINAVDPLHPTADEDANDTNNPRMVVVGTDVVWTYLLTNTGTDSLTVSLAMTPGRPARSRRLAGFVSGDTNDNINSIPETWL